MPSELYLEIVTAERLVYSGPVEFVSAPGMDGRFTILPRHAPLLAALRPGELRLKPSDEIEEVNLAIGGGFLEVNNNRVIVLAHSAEGPSEIDIERARAALDRANQRLKTRVNVDADRARAALERAEARLRVAERHRRRAHSDSER